MSEIPESSLVIIRGLPGSGKTTLAREIAKSCGYLHFESDMFHETEGGYLHDRDAMSAAQGWCYRSTRDALLAGKKVVVSNVFTKLWQLEKFLDLSDSVTVIECAGTYASTHDVPDKVLRNMRAAWEPFQGAIRV